MQRGFTACVPPVNGGRQIMAGAVCGVLLVGPTLAPMVLADRAQVPPPASQAGTQHTSSPRCSTHTIPSLPHSTSALATPIAQMAAVARISAKVGVH